MIDVIVCVREPGRTKIDYSLNFKLPTLPRKGDLISVQRPDKDTPFGEDMVVKEIWWRLDHPETGVISSEPQKTGKMNEIFIECEPATSPYSSDHWKKYVEGQRGTESVPKFDVARVEIRESDLKK